MFDLYLHHGRTTMEGGGTDWNGEEKNDWGFTGPRLSGCIGTHCTYGNMNVWFKDSKAAKEAHKVTGWNFFDDRALEMPTREDCVAARVPHPDGGFIVAFFGDWGLMPTNA